MQPARLPLALSLAALLAAASMTPAAAEEEARTVQEGAHFRVVAHFASEAAAEQMLQAVEALWPHAAKLYGLGQGKLEDLLEVHLYRDAADYEVAMETLAGGKFKRNLAVALWESRTAHVAVQPAVSDEVLAAEGLPYLTRNLLLHEASHLVRFRAMANYRSHPDWLADGAAQWLKFETLRSLGAIQSLVEDPASAREIELAQAKGDVPVATILDDKIQDENWYTVYAVKRMFFTHLMASHGQATRSTLREIKRLGGGVGFTARARSAFENTLGKRKMAGLQAAFARSLRKHKPAWSESIRSLETAGDDWLQLAFPNTNAVAMRTRPVGKKAYTLSAHLRLLPNYGKQANIFLDKRAEGFVSIAITAGFGVNVFSYESEGSRWTSRASRKLAGLEVGKDYEVRVEVDGSRLKVLIGGKVAAEVSFAERKGGLKGPWGLGAQAGSAVRWSKVTVK